MRLTALWKYVSFSMDETAIILSPFLNFMEVFMFVKQLTFLWLYLVYYSYILSVIFNLFYNVYIFKFYGYIHCL